MNQPGKPKMKTMDATEAKLNQPSQLQASEWVKGLPSEDLSLAWRSQLNEKILAEAGRFERKKRVLWFARPTLGLGLACGLAALLFVRTGSFAPVGMPAERKTQSDFVAVHQQLTAESELTGTVVRANEVEPTLPVSNSSTEEWNEADLETL